MRQIGLDGETNEECKTEAASGLLALGMTVVEAMGKEAIRRMESGVLTPEEIEQLGTQLQAIEDETESIQEREEIENDVGELRAELNNLLSEGIKGTYEGYQEEFEG